jgi:hypothetical protein
VPFERLLISLGARSMCGRLASCMVGKQRLTVFLGAGASVGLGIPSTMAVTGAVVSAMQRAENEYQALLGLPRSPLDLNPVDALRAKLDMHYAQQANFEHILHGARCATPASPTDASSTYPSAARR